MDKIQRKINGRRKKKFETYWQMVLRKYNQLPIKLYTNKELKYFLKRIWF